jgi:hypothetical protein
MEKAHSKKNALFYWHKACYIVACKLFKPSNMKMKNLLGIGAMVVFLASCQSVAEKVSGTYTGTWSASGPGFTNTSGIGNANLVLTPDGDKRVDMSFTSPGNPNVNIQDVDITDLFGTYIFNLNNTAGGTIDVSGTIASNILVLTYDNSVDTVSLSLAAFTK